MLDGVMRKLIDPPLGLIGGRLAARGISADRLTLIGLGVGVLAALAIALQWYIVGLVLILGSRFIDGLDGAVARRHGPTDFGGYLDIACDFLFYGLIPLAFVVADPAANAIAGAALLAAFYFNGTTFLGFAVLAEKRQIVTKTRGEKSLYFTGGLLEGTETIAFFVALTLWPAQFPLLAALFAAGCLVTGGSRILLARKLFGGPTP